MGKAHDRARGPNRRIRKQNVKVEQVAHLEAASLAHIDYKFRVTYIVMGVLHLITIGCIWYFGG